MTASATTVRTAIWAVATINSWCPIDLRINFMEVFMVLRPAVRRHLRILVWVSSDENWKNTAICVQGYFHGSILDQQHMKVVSMNFKYSNGNDGRFYLLSKKHLTDILCLFRHARHETGRNYVRFDLFYGFASGLQLFGYLLWCHFHRTAHQHHRYSDDHFTSTTK